MSDDKIIVDLKKAEEVLKPQLSYSDWIKVYDFLSGCEDYEGD